MKKYMKKPVVIEAIEWTGINKQEIDDFVIGTNPYHGFVEDGETMFIDTLEGRMFASKGDMIIKGVKGEFYPCKPDVFELSYIIFDRDVEPTFVDPKIDEDATFFKTLGNTDSNEASKNVKDIVFFGDGDTFELICKASSQNEGWMKSTKAMEVEQVGCVVQTTTQQKNPDNSYSIADALTFIPNCKIQRFFDEENKVIERKIVHIQKTIQ